MPKRKLLDVAGGEEPPMLVLPSYRIRGTSRPPEEPERETECIMTKSFVARSTDRLAARHNLRGNEFRAMINMMIPFAFFNILFALSVSFHPADTQSIDFIDM